MPAVLNLVPSSQRKRRRRAPTAVRGLLPVAESRGGDAGRGLAEDLLALVKAGLIVPEERNGQLAFAPRDDDACA